MTDHDAPIDSPVPPAPEQVPEHAQENAQENAPDQRGDERPRQGKRGQQFRRPKHDVHGWVVLDKPVGMTSTQAVGAIKRLFKAKRVGHAGTLDPLASGCLPIALGEATKTVPFVMDSRKAYRFIVRWGEERDTDDAEGQVIATSDQRPSPEAIEALLPAYTGVIEQVPPQYSAIKIAGERAYDLARDGQHVDLQARSVEIFQLSMVNRPDSDHAEFVAECGKGTYVRSLARDMGRVLGCRGHITALRRERVGSFDQTTMITLEQLEAMCHRAAVGEASLADALMPVETALDDIPALAISRADAARLQRGQAVLLRGRDAPIFRGTVYITASDQLVALADVDRGEIIPKRVFNLAGLVGSRCLPTKVSDDVAIHQPQG